MGIVSYSFSKECYKSGYRVSIHNITECSNIGYSLDIISSQLLCCIIESGSAIFLAPTQAERSSFSISTIVCKSSRVLTCLCFAIISYTYHPHLDGTIQYVVLSEQYACVSFPGFNNSLGMSPVDYSIAPAHGLSQTATGMPAITTHGS